MARGIKKEKNNGYIIVDSKENVGTKFQIKYFEI